MYNEMSQISQDRSVDTDNTMPVGLFTFNSLFCELDENLDKFEIRPKNVFTNETELKKVRTTNVLAQPQRAGSNSLSMVDNTMPSFVSRDDPLRKSIDSTKIDFHHPTSTSNNMLPSGGLGSKPNIAGSNASTFGASNNNLGGLAKPNNGKYSVLLRLISVQFSPFYFW